MHHHQHLWLAALIAASVSFGSVDARTYETIDGHPCLRSYDGLMDWMSYFAEDHPELVRISKIGESWLKNNEGRHDGVHEIPDGGFDIYALNVTASNSARTSEEKGKMLLTSGVHAREYAPPELLARFLEMLVQGYNNDADITWILEHVEVHAILYVNPDGRFMAEQYPGLYWRKNLNPVRCGGGSEYGVDLNRNFNFFWGDTNGASNYACDSDYHGPSPESEPETQAMAEYARNLFPEDQRREFPMEQIDEPFGEDNTGMYIDIHASGGYVYYPWGHKDEKSPDDESLQALGRKINSFNDYKLWAGDQPDFVYEASGDTSDWAYGVLGVATYGLEIGDNFYQECTTFEEEVVPKNLPALLFSAKTVAKPFSVIKGPDVLEIEAHSVNGEVRISAHVSDSQMVNAIEDFPDFRTGDQSITQVRLYLDVHPDDYTKEGTDVAWEMEPVDAALDSDEETVGLVLSARDHFSVGRHRLFVRATDSDGYDGPVSSVFVDIAESDTSLRAASLRGATHPSP